MTKQKIIGVVVGLMLLIVVGAGYTLHKHNENELMLDEQNRIARYFVENYGGVEQIEFGEFVKNTTTGSYTTLVKLNQTNKIHVTFYDFEDTEDKYVTGWNAKTFKLKEKNSPTALDSLSDIDIIYCEVVKKL